MAFRGAMSSALSTEFSSTTSLLWPRAPQTSESQTNIESGPSPSHSSTAGTASSSIATSSRPFFQGPPTDTSSASSNQSQAVSKAVLEYILIVAFSMIFAGLLVQRVLFRRRNHALLWRRSSPPDTDVPALPRRFPRTTGLTQVPPYPYSRRTRAHDTDAAGRRVIDTVNTSDHDGYIGDKDVLPAYDNSGRPPQYREVALELNMMPTIRTVMSENSTITGNAGDSHPPPRDPGDASETRDSNSFSGSGQVTADAILDLESPTVPPAAHVRQ
ncbi:hypothetical protein H2248_009047 [Termitomyces sp. 'cryptogamus']|nr:hypothetical protein H2248_009047 [Termitomyces sp. 'cryptogamus']